MSYIPIPIASALKSGMERLLDVQRLTRLRTVSNDQENLGKVTL